MPTPPTKVVENKEEVIKLEVIEQPEPIVLPVSTPTVTFSRFEEMKRVVKVEKAQESAKTKALKKSKAISISRHVGFLQILEKLEETEEKPQVENEKKVVVKHVQSARKNQKKGRKNRKVEPPKEEFEPYEEDHYNFKRKFTK